MNAIAPIDLGKDINVIKLAREVAINHYPIDDILNRYSITPDVWDALNEWPRFKELVEIERANWNSATNTNTRIRLKSATLIEEWMEEGYTLLHDKSQTFNSKIELLKLLGKFSQLDTPQKMEGEVAGRVTINIKIGETQLAYDGDGTQMIDASVVEEDDPDTISFDWDEEFAANPALDAHEVFEDYITPE